MWTYNRLSLATVGIPNVTVSAPIQVNVPQIHLKMRSICQGNSPTVYFYSTEGIGTYWPYLGTPNSPDKAGEGGYVWPNIDTKFFDTIKDPQLARLYPAYLWLNSTQRNKYQDMWLLLGDFYNDYHLGKFAGESEPDPNYIGVSDTYTGGKVVMRRKPGSPFMSEETFIRQYNDRIREIWQYEINAFPRFNWDDIEVCRYHVPYWDEYSPQDQAKLRSVAKERESVITSPTSPFSSKEYMYIYFFQYQAQLFPWNDKTCADFLIGYSDLTRAQKDEYQKRRKDINYFYGGLTTGYKAAVVAIQNKELELRFFEHDVSPKLIETEKKIQTLSEAIGADLSAKAEAKFRSNYAAIFKTDFAGTGISIGQVLSGVAEASKVIALVGAAALTAVSVGTAAPLAASVAGATGVSTTVAGAAIGAAATGGAKALTGGDAFAVLPEFGLTAGKDIADKFTLTGEKDVGLFDEVKAFGNDTLNSLGGVSLGNIGGSVSSLANSVGNIGLADVGSFFGNLTVGDVRSVADAVTATPVTQSAQAAANSAPQGAAKVVAQKISENKGSIAIVLGVGVLAYFLVKGKF